MASLQIRDMPEELYEALSERARRERRSLAQQAVADLLNVEEFQSRERRISVIDELRMESGVKSRKFSDPVRIVRRDRER